MSTQLMQLLVIAAIVGPVLGLLIGILVGSALARWHHVHFLKHAPYPLAPHDQQKAQPLRPRMEDLHYR
ncbi:MAG: hypothetical protein JO202_01670 [Ktedonobacteraceae bacterium]|nr:hypothetical protein [Ktedonobacteraceae bacterium]